ncbi:MAG: ABC transporter ATP-binding protein, partial [candidate division Zixibacteria bacterium]|nr:ABC transporter ATP-binding protein [candidate division Zixibacteria bacterium]
MNSAYWEEEQENGIEARQAFKKLLPLLKPHKSRLLRNLLLLVAATGISIVGPLLISHAVDAYIVPRHNYIGLLLTTGVYLLLQVGCLVSRYFQRVHLETIGQDVITALKRRCFDHITRLSVAFFDKNPVGRLMSRVESDGESLRMLFTNVVVMVVGDLLLVSGMLGIMFYIDWRLTLLALVIVPPVALLLYFFQKYTTPRFLQVRKRMADIAATITEYLQGMSVIQVFNRQRTAQRKVYDVNRAKFMIDRNAEWAVVSFFNMVFFMEAVAIGLVLYFGANFILQEQLTAGVLVMFILYIRRFFEPIHNFSEEVHIIQKAIAGARRIFALLSNDQMIREPAKPKCWPGLEKVIRFEDVSFSYRGDDNYAVENISFEVNKGETVALVGVTGGGKSTIANLLLRFYDCSKGRITVDGIDIRDLTTEDLRAKVGLGLQDIFLFPGNIRDTITLEQ